MSLNANNYNRDTKFERPDPLDPGTYPARVVQIVSLGLQPQRPFKGEEKPPKHELYIAYEFLDEFLKDDDGNDIEDKPRWLSETLTMNGLDSDLAKSTKRYLALDPEIKYKGDWSKLTGSPCMATVTQAKSKSDESKIYNNISSVQTMRAKEASKAVGLKNEPKVFDLEEPDMEVFNSFPKWLQDKIKDNLEFGGSILEKLLENEEGTEKVSKKKANTKSLKDEEVDEAESDEEEVW
jgi:hypothetical protein